MTKDPPLADPRTIRRPNPLVFLSSTVAGIRSERAAIYEYGQRYGPRAVWVDEQYRDIPTSESAGAHETYPPDPNPLPDIDDYLRELRRSKLYVAWIAGPRVGTPVLSGTGGPALATFFELELAYAAVLGRAIALVQVKGVRPSPQLGYLLQMVSRVLEVRSHEVDTVQEGVATIKRLVDDTASGAFDALTTTPAAYGRFLADRWRVRDISLRWLSNDWPRFANHAEPDHGVVDGMLRNVTTVDTAEQKLARLWIAAREVMCIPYWYADPTRRSRQARAQHDHAKQWLDAWNRVLTAWNSAGAWYGLHGHLELGYLAAINSLVDIRRIGRAVSPVRRDDPAWDEPWSAQASAYYAVARRVGSRPLRLKGLLKAWQLLKRARYRDPLSRSDGLAILGSVYLQLGNIPGGLLAYQRVLRIRERIGAHAGSVGEAMTELGYVYARIPGIRRRGIDLLQDGIATMAGANYDRGFVVRAKYKLADALERMGDSRAAAAARGEALALAVEGTIGTAARDYSNPHWRRR